MDEGARGVPGRVVVVDDDPMFVELMGQLLTVVGEHEVLSPEHWSGAHDFVRTAKPDLVILDVVIGRQEEGWEILERLSADPETSGVPVIVCSAAVQSVEARAADLASRGVRTLLK